MRKILVIEDSKMMRLYLRRVLEKNDYEVEEYVPESAMDVEGHIRKVAPDLVITDYQMPGCNGITIVKMVKKVNPALPVMVITAFSDQRTQETLERLGAACVLGKPVDHEDVARSVLMIFCDDI